MIHLGYDFHLLNYLNLCYSKTTMKKNFILRIKDKNAGPLDINEVLELLKKQEINSSTMYFNTEKRIWKMVGENEEFSQFLPTKPDVYVLTKKFYLFKHDKVVGPYNRDQILEKILKQDLSFFDYLFTDYFSEWRRIVDISDFDSYRHYKGAEAKEKNDNEDDPNKVQWYLENKEKFPKHYYFTEIVHMLETDLISFEDKIRSSNMSEPKPIKEIDIFALDNLIKIKMGGQSEQISDHGHPLRKHPRCAFYAPAIIKIKGKEMHGVCSLLSIGGCFVELRPMPTNIKMSDELELKIIPGGTPIELECRASVRSVLERGVKGIGLSFIDLEEKKVESIKKYVDKYINKAI